MKRIIGKLHDRIAKALEPDISKASFRKDESGSFVIFGLFIFLLMLMIGGMAVDLMRFETNRARLQSTLDRAVLAAASLDQPMEPVDVVIDYFEKAGLAAYIAPEDVIVTDTLTARRVSAEATLRVNSTFMRLLGIDYIDAPAAGAAEESASRTEVSLVVDVSGSMSWGSSSGRSKIAELRDAATDFVNIMMCNPEDPDETEDCTVTEDTVSITLIPYDEQVVAGSLIMDELTVTDEHSESHCITFDLADFDDAGMDMEHEFQRTGHFDPWWDRWDWPGRWACKTDAWREILPFANDPADLRDQIGDLRGDGYTSIDLGMKWAGAFLDSDFQPLIQALVDDGVITEEFDDRPFSYSENGIKKVVVIMTDGVNTTQHYLFDDFREGPSGVFTNVEFPGEHSIRRWDDDNDDGIMDDDEVDYFWTDDWDWHDHAQGNGEIEECDWEYNWPEGWEYICNTEDEPGVGVELTFQQLWKQVTWDWYFAWNWLDDPGDDFGRTTKDARLDTICDAVKGQNVTVFSIGFEVTSASAAVMRSCASSPAHFFDVEGEDLSEAFASIARAISALRLVN